MPPKKRPLEQTNLEKESEKDDETLDGENFKDTAQGPVSKASKYSEDNDNTEHVFRPDITRRQIEHFFTHYKDLEAGKLGQVRRLGRSR